MKRVLAYLQDGSMDIADIEGKDELRALQVIVGGHIEGVSLSSEIMLICNEEGKYKCTPNPAGMGWIPGDIIFGAFCVTRIDGEGETVDLTDEDIAAYGRMSPN